MREFLSWAQRQYRIDVTASTVERKTGGPASAGACRGGCKEIFRKGSNAHSIRLTCKICGTVRKEERHPPRQDPATCSRRHMDHWGSNAHTRRRDESQGENRCGRGRTKTKYRWDDVNDDDKDRPQMADDDSIDSQALTGGDITRFRALVARISYLSQDRPHLKFAWMRVCCAIAQPSMRDWNASRDLAGTSSASREQSVGSAGNRVVTWRSTQMLTREAT